MGLSLHVRRGIRISQIGLAGMLLLGCASSGAFNQNTTTPTSSGGSTGGTTSNGKPVLKGLVTQGSTPSPGSLPANTFAELNAHPQVYSAAVIDLYWSQLEPSQGVFDDSALVSALASLAAYNAKYPATPVVAKLRIFMGLGTPAMGHQRHGRGHADRFERLLRNSRGVLDGQLPSPLAGTAKSPGGRV